VIVLYVRNCPDVAGVFSEWIARILPGLRSLEIFLARIFLRHTDRIKIENTIGSLCEPQDRFITPREACPAVQPVFEAPNDPVTQPKAKPLGDAIDEYIEGKDLAAFPDMVPGLPAQAAIVGQDPHALLERVALRLQIFGETELFLVFLSDVIGRRRYNQASGTIWNASKEIQSIAFEKRSRYTRSVPWGDPGATFLKQAILLPNA
jgi:hypothetical protein